MACANYTYVDVRFGAFLRFCASMEYRSMLTGFCVGATDIALFYPLAVLATRRENGKTIMQALRMGKYYSGGLTAGALVRIKLAVCRF